MLRRRLSAWWLVLRIGLPYVIVLRLVAWWPSVGRRLQQGLHSWGAGVVYRHIVRQGGLLIKVGQYIASRPDIFPLPYVDALSSLRDTVPARPLQTLLPSLQRAYQGRLEEHLVDIEETALAAASFGQVHRAVTKEGDSVAVKIQYPDLLPGVKADVALVRLVVRLMKPLFPGWPLQLIAEEIERSSREELDYLFEGRNGDLLRDGLAQQGLRVPQIYWQHTRETVLVMEFAPGQSLANADLGELSQATRLEIAETLVDGFLHQLLAERFFHADPHGGNVLLDVHADKSWDLWLIDFGMTARLTAGEGELYGRFLLCLQQNDTDGMVDVLAKLGFLLPGADREGLKALAREVYSELAHLNPLTFKGSRRQADLASKINLFIRRMRGLTFPRHTLLLTRATALIEGLCMDLVPDRNFLDIVRPRLSQSLTWQTRLRWLRETIVDTLNDWRAIPDRVASLQRSVDQLAARDDGVLTMVAALALVAVMMLPEETRLWPAVCAGLALLLLLRQRFRRN